MGSKSIWSNTRAPSPMMEWTDEEICRFYEQNPDLLIAKFAPMVGRSREELKKILIPESKNV